MGRACSTLCREKEPDIELIVWETTNQEKFNFNPDMQEGEIQKISNTKLFIIKSRK